MNDVLFELAARLGQRLHAEGLMMATAESCTGGWVGKALTDVPGSSAWFDRGYVTYSNRAKQEVLGVRPETLARYGAVSEATVREMAEGAIRFGGVDLALAVSGLAGPGGGSAGKPVGTVWFAWARRGMDTTARRMLFYGDRDAVRRQAVRTAIRGALGHLGDLQ